MKFKFNFIIHETDNPQKAFRNASYYLHGKKDGKDVLVQPAVFTTSARNSGTAWCTTYAKFWVTEARYGAPDLTYAHEAGHTLGLDDNGYDKGGLLGHHPVPILPSEVDEIWEKSYSK